MQQSATEARIHSQFESLGFVGKYDQSPTKLVNIEIRGSGFSAKSSDFLPPKWSKNAGLKLIVIVVVKFDGQIFLFAFVTIGDWINTPAS
jgi:hypothetical protein